MPKKPVTPKFKKPSRDPDVTVQLDQPHWLRNLYMCIWFKELKFVLKIKTSGSKRSRMFDEGFIDRITSLHGPHKWVVYEKFYNVTMPTHAYEDNWLNHAVSLYGLNYIDQIADFELQEKIEKAYQNWLFQEELEKALKS